MLTGRTLFVDQTGVGAPVIQLLLRKTDCPRLIPVTITADLDAALDVRGGWLAPKLKSDALERFVQDLTADEAKSVRDTVAWHRI